MALGDKENTISWLEKDLADHSNWITQLFIDEVFDPVRNEPRVQAIFRATGQIR